MSVNNLSKSKVLIHKVFMKTPYFHIMGAALVALLAANIADADEKLEGPPKASAKETEDPNRLTLHQCIERALKNSPNLAAQRHTLAAMEAKIGQSIWAPFSQWRLRGAFTVVPDKCVDTEVLNNEGRLVDCNSSQAITGEEDISTSEWGPAFFFGLEGIVPLYTFGKITSVKDAAKAGKKAKEAEFPRFEHRIKYDVQRAFHAIVGAREMLYTLSQGKKHLVKAKKKLEKNLENEEGEETQVDLIKLKLFESNVEHLEMQTIQIEETALAALRYLVGGENSNNIDVPEDPQVLAEYKILPLETYQKSAIESRPEIDALRHAAKALEAKVDLRKAEFFPDLALQMRLGFGWTPGRTDVSNWLVRDGYNYGSWLPAFLLVMNYNLDFGLDKHRLDEARAQLATHAANQQEAFEGIMLEVRSAYIDLSSTQKSLQNLEKSKRLVKGWMAAAIQNFSAGLGKSREVKDALKEYFKVMASVHKLIAEYNTGLAHLEKVTGVAENGKEKSSISE